MKAIDYTVSNSSLKQSKRLTWIKSIVNYKYVKQNKWLYILLIPGLLYFVIFNYVPMYGVIIAFQDFNMALGLNSPWVGIQNYRHMFGSAIFYEIFRNSVLINLYRLMWGFPAPILLALMLNEVKNMIYKRTIQTVVYLPFFISWVVVAGMVQNFLSPTVGILNHVIELLGGESIAFLQKPEYFRSILVISEIWKDAGWGTIIYLAAMTKIDEQLYEAAIIDGASRLQRIRYITLPGIASTIVVLLILRMGSILRNGFEQIFMLYSPLVFEVADVFETYVYRIGILEGRFGFAAAVSLFQSFVGLVFILVANKLARKYGDGGLW